MNQQTDGETTCFLLLIFSASLGSAPTTPLLFSLPVSVCVHRGAAGVGGSASDGHAKPRLQLPEAPRQPPPPPLCKQAGLVGAPRLQRQSAGVPGGEQSQALQNRTGTSPPPGLPPRRTTASCLRRGENNAWGGAQKRAGEKSGETSVTAGEWMEAITLKPKTGDTCGAPVTLLFCTHTRLNHTFSGVIALHFKINAARREIVILPQSNASKSASFGRR